MATYLLNPLPHIIQKRKGGGTSTHNEPSHNCQNIDLIYRIKEDVYKMKEEILTKIEAVDKKVESLTTMVEFIKKEQNGQKNELKNKISKNEREEILKKIDDLQSIMLKLLFFLLSGTASLIVAMIMLILKGGV